MIMVYILGYGFIALVVIYGLYMQRSCPERVETGDMIGGGRLCR